MSSQPSEIKPWIDIDATVRQWLDGRTEPDIHPPIPVMLTSPWQVGCICGAKYTPIGEVLARVPSTPAGAAHSEVSDGAQL